jgi:hypothetical protein
MYSWIVMITSSASDYAPAFDQIKLKRVRRIAFEIALFIYKASCKRKSENRSLSSYVENAKT